MIYENIELRVDPDAADQFIADFTATRELLLEAAVCQEAGLLRNVHNPDTYLLRLGWDRIEDYTETFPGAFLPTLLAQVLPTDFVTPVRNFDCSARQENVRGSAALSGNATTAGEEGIAATNAMSRVRAVLDSLGEDHKSSMEAEHFRYFCAQLDHYGSSRNNPIVTVIDHVGNYWRNWLLMITRPGPYRPSTIRKLLEALDPSHPISQRMLTLNLRLLERDGLVERRVIDDERRHVEYSLTPLGWGLSNKLLSLIEWIDQHAGEIEKASASYSSD